MIDKLILKYLDGSISNDEFEDLSELLKNPKNQDIFKTYIQDNHDLDLSLSRVNLKEDFSNINAKLQVKKKSLQTYNSLLRYAAVIICILGISYFYFLQSPSPVIHYVNVPSNKFITIEKNNGGIEKILEGESREMTNEKGDVIGLIDKGQLILDENSTAKPGTIHTINVPYGRQFKITLADGTKISLNSGSSLSYPLTFKNVSERKVFLEGEAYFSVASNKEVPFIVESENVYSKVVGTEFNYSAYKEDENTDIVLVEGAVKVGLTNILNNENPNQILLPSQKATHSVSKKSIKVQEVDVQKYIAWTQGSLVFEDDEMKNILKILQRHYAVEIVNKYPDLYNYRFSGVFKDVNIEDILKTIQAHTPFNFEIKGDKVIIEPITKQ